MLVYTSSIEIQKVKVEYMSPTHRNKKALKSDLRSNSRLYVFNVLIKIGNK